MKTSSKLLFMLLIALLCNACLFLNRPKHSILGTWKLHKVESNDTKSSFDKESKLNEATKDGNLLNIYKDKSASLVEGETYISANWSLNEDESEINIEEPGSKTTKFKLKFDNTRDGREILKLADESNGLTRVFVKEASPLADIKSEPFHQLNNQWRMKSDTPESKLQIRKRLENYIKHVSLILYAAKELKPDIVSFEFSKGPIRIYSSGIGIYPFELVTSTWKGCFFSEQEARAAYETYQAYLKYNTYKGAASGKWVDDDYQILLSIYNGLKKEGETVGGKLAK